MTNLCFEDLPFGITTIDTGYLRPGFAASHLIIEGEHAAFVDVGTSYSSAQFMEMLRLKGIPRQKVDYVIVTHVHLDHAGGAGELMRRLPCARLVVHPRGARHMIDPAKLIAGATAVYGEVEMRKNYGVIVPVPEARVIEAVDKLLIKLNGRELLFLETPGHARHHVCVVDEKSGGIFTGDAFGLSYREFDTDNGPFIFPTTSPVQFDPAAMHASIDRIMDHKPRHMYLTHYGKVQNVIELTGELHDRIDRFVALAKSLTDSGEHRHTLLVDGLADIIVNDLIRHGCKLGRQEILELLALDLELNAQGLEVWLDRQAERRNVAQ